MSYILIVQDHALQGDAAIGAYSAVFHVVDTGGLLALLSLMSKVVRNKEAAPVQPVLLDRRLAGPPPTTHLVPRRRM